jgi:hypothetical protein
LENYGKTMGKPENLGEEMRKYVKRWNMESENS